MAYDLSFSEEFFTGSEDYYEMTVSERPTNVLQAILSLSAETRRGIAKDVLGIEPDSVEFAIESDMFDIDVLDQLRKTNTCDSYSSPVTVYIDEEGFYSVTVYE